jgi:trimeric autotransporter adhesin
MRGRCLWLFAFFALFLAGCLDTTGTAPLPHRLGGSVEGLSGQLTLFANGSAVTVKESGPFFFPAVFSVGTPYEVVVIDEPDQQDCVVKNGKGVVGAADVTNIQVLCTEQTLFRIGGKVTGLSGKLVLRNGTDTVSVSADGEFFFPVMVDDGTPYAVGVEQEPVNQACTIAGSVGAVMAADVTNVNVTCLVDDARLVDLVLSEGTLSPAFKGETSIYLSNVNLLVPTITLIPTAASADAIITVNEEVVVSGMESSPIHLDLGTNIINVRVQAPSGAEREYAVFLSREEKLATTYIKSTNVAGGDNFGIPVAISGDIMAVGAPGEDSGATGINADQGNNDRSGSGAVYVFVRQGDTWKQEAYIKASNTDYNDEFGSSLAIDGDTLVVGSPGEDSNANIIGGNQNDEGSQNSGAVYVFVRDAAGTWTQQAYIKASNNDANDDFGHAVAISGNTIAVGAPAEDSSATGINMDQSSDSEIDSGAVYVYFRSGTMWQQQAYIKASNTDFTDKFGASVALHGDTLAVGATDEDSSTTGIGAQTNESAFEAGAAYVFVRSAGMWSQQAFIKPSNTQGGDRFGGAVALGENRLVVGAHAEDSGAAGIGGIQSDNGASDAGAVYVFARTGTTWTQEAYIKASNPDANDNFGYSVALFGDLIAVGAYAEDSSGVGLNPSQQSNSEGATGAVYLFSRDKDTWSQVGYLKSLNSDSGDEFGKSVALSGSVLVCGSHLEDSGYPGVNANPYNEGATDSGAVFVYH